MPDEKVAKEVVEEKPEATELAEGFDDVPPEKEEVKDELKKESEEVEEKEEDKEGDKKPPEKPGEEKETDWKAERDKLQDALNKKTKEAQANKAFADDQARQRAEGDRKRLEEDEKKKKEALEVVPEDVQAFIDEYPEAEKTIKHFGEVVVTKAIDELKGEIREACGGRDLGTFIRESTEYVNQVQFERDVQLGFMDDNGKYVAGHPDVLAITRSQEFIDYNEKQTKEDPTYAKRQNIPEEAIKIITNFKKEQLAKATKKEGKELKKEKEEMEEQMTPTAKEAMRKGDMKEPDKNDFDAGFDGV